MSFPVGTFRLGRRAALAGLGAISVLQGSRPAVAENADTPRQGGTLTVAIQNDSKTLDPTFSFQWAERQILFLIYNTLIATDLDFSLKPELATSWSPENEGHRYVLQLQEGVKFHDGTDFDAAAVKWNLDRRLDDKVNSTQRPQLRPVIESVEVAGPHAVAINLTAPYPPLLAALADRAGFMVSPSAVQKYGQDFGRNPVGTGAFVFKDWNQGVDVTVERNPNYWQKGLPHWDRIVFNDIGTLNIGIQRLLTGEADYLDALSVDELRQIQGDDKLRVEKAKIGRWYTLQFQVDKPPFNDIRLRKAIAYALDRDKINAITMGGQARISNGPIPSGVWWSSPDAIVYDREPARSKELLKQAGIAPGTRLVLSAPDNAVLRKLVQLVVEQLGEVGLDVRLQPVAQSEWYARVVQKAIDFTPMRWTQLADPDGMLYVLLDSKGYANTTGYSNPEVDRMLEEARQSLDQAKRKALYAAVKTKVMEDLPYIPLYFSAEYAAIAKSVKGFAWPPDQIPRFRDTWRGEA
ncbi:MAG: hypothetical protein JO209_03285 [Acidisphaera sp.]|nr:hypothetical protein [Acidisphaera sp.]